MGIVWFNKMYVEYFDGVFNQNIISEIIKCFNLCLNEDTNLVRSKANALLWKAYMEDHIISSFLASPEWEYKEWDQLKSLIKEFNEFRNVYFKHYINYAGSLIDLSHGFKHIDKMAIEKAKFKIDANSTLDDLVDFINDNSKCVYKKNKKKNKINNKKEIHEEKSNDMNCHKGHGVRIIDSSEGSLCCICYEYPNNSVFIPCGH
jgi:hypothetical protein